MSVAVKLFRTPTGWIVKTADGHFRVPPCNVPALTAHEDLAAMLAAGSPRSSLLTHGARSTAVAPIDRQEVWAGGCHLFQESDGADGRIQGLVRESLLRPGLQRRASRALFQVGRVAGRRTGWSGADSYGRISGTCRNRSWLLWSRRPGRSWATRLATTCPRGTSKGRIRCICPRPRSTTVRARSGPASS